MGWELIIGENLRRLRKARGLTQEGLASEIDLDVRLCWRASTGIVWVEFRRPIELAAANSLAGGPVSQPSLGGLWAELPERPLRANGPLRGKALVKFF